MWRDFQFLFRKGRAPVYPGGESDGMDSDAVVTVMKEKQTDLDPDLSIDAPVLF